MVAYPRDLFGIGLDIEYNCEFAITSFGDGIKLQSFGQAFEVNIFADRKAEEEILDWLQKRKDFRETEAEKMLEIEALET